MKSKHDVIGSQSRSIVQYTYLFYCLDYAFLDTVKTGQKSRLKSKEKQMNKIVEIVQIQATGFATRPG